MQETNYTRSFTPYFSRSLSGLRYLPFKRVFDLLITLLLLILFSIPMLTIATGIKVFSPGPVFYRQRRIGKNGEPFEMLKFRSMQSNTVPDLHRNHVQKLIIENSDPTQLGLKTLKLKSDPRITRIGRILRKFSLDELPQFFNVLKGEMSLVGPRPPLPYEYEVYREWHKQRQAVLPGITGFWQVTARNTVSFEDMVEMDLFYIENQNFWLDLKIILMTPYEMIIGKGGG